MVTSARASNWIERSERRVLKTGTRTALVKYKTPGTGTHRMKIAQLADISATGAQIISRLPMDAAVGSLVNLEFTLPGVQRRLFQKACIVRKINEIAFAVCFVRGNPGEPSTVEQALTEFDFLQRRSLAPRQLTLVSKWYATHLQGVRIFLITITLALLALGMTSRGRPEKTKTQKLSSQGSFQGWDANGIKSRE